MAVEDEGLHRQARHRVQAQVLEVAVEEGLDAAVHRAEVVGQQPVLLPVALEQVVGGLDEPRRLAGAAGRLPGGHQLEVDIELQLLALVRRQGGGGAGAGVETKLADEVHSGYTWG